MLLPRIAMQRLFSAFPNSWPGAGLLLLRIAAAAAAILCSFGAPPQQELAVKLFQGIAATTGALLLVGLWTPMAGLLQFVLELASGFTRGAFGFNQLLLGALGLSLCMIGPGAWSIDARLFGRKQIDFN